MITNPFTGQVLNSRPKLLNRDAPKPDAPEPFFSTPEGTSDRAEERRTVSKYYGSKRSRKAKVRRKQGVKPVKGLGMKYDKSIYSYLK